MPFTLHSSSIYEEIVVHTTLNMMTKLTDVIQPEIRNGDYAEKRSEAFRKALIGAAEATLVERKESNLLLSDLD